ncbi:hypothetical protein [Candidatus Amoebophilus asiaticus]|nr:hypothetical protein [Candidatus Amoebophilus asiaticus]
MIEHGANINIEDDEGLAPMDVANQKGYTVLVNLIREAQERQDNSL